MCEVLLIPVAAVREPLPGHIGIECPRMNKQEPYQLFAQVIWDWFTRHKRTLPWRDLTIEDRNQRAYMVLVSEVMLQQTQVPRVIPAFKAFLERFPTIESLAKASNKDILIQWRGMGYNSRALRLRDAAKTIADKLGGHVPDTMEGLMDIKGIGEYTAAAVRNFAFGIPTACIDTNIRRILHRAFIGPENPDGTWKTDDKRLMILAEETLIAALETGRGTCSDWHAALMDYGSLVCTRRNPKWDICPLTKRGFMKAAYKTPAAIVKTKKEPGRMVGSSFVPNRIFRGRIVEVLRDSDRGLSPAAIGPLISKDWEKKEHSKWLNGLIEKLVADQMLIKKAGKYELRV
jgi:A/G-specific adenine glycosylase